MTSWGPVVDQILADEQVTSLASGGNVIWPLTDHLGTARDLAQYNAGTDTTSITNHRIYDSFGNLVSETNAAVDHLFGFTARPWDEETGLQNNLNRWYDPVTGQWLSEDPIGFEGQDANLVRYVGNRTLISADPTGLYEARKIKVYIGHNGWVHTQVENEMKGPAATDSFVAGIACGGDSKSDINKYLRDEVGAQTVDNLPRLPLKMWRPKSAGAFNIAERAGQQQNVDEEKLDAHAMEYGFVKPDTVPDSKWGGRLVKSDLSPTEMKDHLQRKYLMVVRAIVLRVENKAIEMLNDDPTRPVIVEFYPQWKNGVISLDNFVEDVWGIGVSNALNTRTLTGETDGVKKKYEYFRSSSSTFVVDSLRITFSSVNGKPNHKPCTYPPGGFPGSKPASTEGMHLP
jgi:RHS repeat-associated protein